MGEFESALDCHMQHLKLSKKLGNKVKLNLNNYFILILIFYVLMIRSKKQELIATWVHLTIIGEISLKLLHIMKMF